MLLVLGLMALIWGVGYALGLPVRGRLAGVGAVWLGVMALHLGLADGHKLRLATGGRAEVWLVLAGVAGLALGYRRLVGGLRQPHQGVGLVEETGAFGAAELERYARHIALREIGGAGQRRLKEAKVLVVGAGGLGAPALLYLAGAGVGVIGVIDHDVVESSNLQRQIIHTDQSIGQPKVRSAMVAMKALNPFIEVKPYARRLEADIAFSLIADYDLVLDASDSFETRELVNRACVAQGKPLISGAITQWEGQLSLYHPAAGGPCYACVFPARPAPGLVPTCAEAGVAAPLPGVLGSMMALEAIKHLTSAGGTLRGRVVVYDGLNFVVRVVAARRRKDCPVCGAGG